MKHLWISLGLLIVLSGITTVHIQVINRFVEPMGKQLESAAQYARAGDWDGAIDLTEQAYTHWKSYDAYLHLTTIHANIDAVETLFHEVGSYLEFQELGEYAATNARLTAQIERIRSAEEFSLHNIL